jgi:hypothetical protein
MILSLMFITRHSYVDARSNAWLRVNGQLAAGVQPLQFHKGSISGRALKGVWQYRGLSVLGLSPVGHF